MSDYSLGELLRYRAPRRDLTVVFLTDADEDRATVALKTGKTWKCQQVQVTFLRRLSFGLKPKVRLQLRETDATLDPWVLEMGSGSTAVALQSFPTATAAKPTIHAVGLALLQAGHMVSWTNESAG